MPDCVLDRITEKRAATGKRSCPKALTDLLAQVGLGSAIILIAYANKQALCAIKMMALPVGFLELG